jgi:Cu/Zn superoxide dismutase
MRKFITVVAAATLGAVLAPVPASAAPAGTVVARGPGYVYDKAYAGVRTYLFAYHEKSGGTIFAFLVRGMPKSTWGKRYGVHVHTKPCTANPAAAGPHFMLPTAPKSLPLGQREIWLDVTVTAGGWALSTRTVMWPIPAGSPANSVVLHAAPTNPKTGEAGARVVCMTAPLANVGVSG